MERQQLSVTVTLPSGEQLLVKVFDSYVAVDIRPSVTGKWSPYYDWTSLVERFRDGSA